MEGLKRRFLTFDAADSPSRIADCFRNYRDYLHRNRDRFPTEVFEFATAEWHYNAEDHRCPHDSWLMDIVVGGEESTGKEGPKDISLKLTLLGAYHDGEIELFYNNVQLHFYQKRPSAVFGDWLIDEISLKNDDTVIHSIEFSNSSRWLVHCENMAYRWVPLS